MDELERNWKAIDKVNYQILNKIKDAEVKKQKGIRRLMTQITRTMEIGKDIKIQYPTSSDSDGASNTDSSSSYSGEENSNVTFCTDLPKDISPKIEEP